MPRNKNGTVGIKSDRPALRVVCEPPRRRTNREVRVREYLTTEELQRLIKAARKHGRNSGRDALMIAMATRHGLRASELCSMLWSQIDWKTARLTVLRNKGSVDSTHPLTGGELRALRAIRRGGKRRRALCFHVGTRGADDTGRLSQDAVAGRCAVRAADSSSAHAAPLVRIRDGRGGRRRACDARLARPCRDPEHRSIYGTRSRQAGQGQSTGPDLTVGNLAGPVFAANASLVEWIIGATRGGLFDNRNRNGFSTRASEPLAFWHRRTRCRV